MFIKINIKFKIIYVESVVELQGFSTPYVMPSQETLQLLAQVYLAHVPLSPVNMDELKFIT
jgi:hypothetical protein